MSTPDHDLTPQELERSLRCSYLHGLLGTIFAASVGGMFLTGFALKLGASNLQIGVLAAIPSALAGSQLWSAYVLERNGQRKRLCLRSAALGVSVWAFAAAIPYLLPAHPQWLRLYALFAVVAVAAVASMVVVNAWTSWIADLVPAHRYGRFFAMRGVFAGPAAMAFAMLEGVFLDWAKTLQAFCLVFLVGVAAGWASILVLRRQADVPMHRRQDENGQHMGMLALLREALRHPRLRAITLFVLAWRCAWMISAPFYMVFMLKSLHMKFLWVGGLTTAYSVVAVLSNTFWGAVADRTGGKRMLVATTIISVLVTLPWLVVTRGNFWWLLPLLYACGAFLDTGWGLGLTTLLLGSIPKEGRSTYLALYGTITGSLGAFAPVVGGAVATLVQASRVQVLWLDTLQVIFAISLALAALCLPLLRTLGDPRKPEWDGQAAATGTR